MTGRFPEIPTQAKEMKQEVREELMREIRKREASREANISEEAPRKNKENGDRAPHHQDN